jgi:MscS family membrane protein
VKPPITLAAAVCLLLLLAAPAAPQGGLLPGAKSAAAPAQATAAPVPADPLGRETPAGTVMGFIGASTKQDYVTAAKYLDTKLPPERAAELVHQLKVVLDRGLAVDLSRLSKKPEGEQDERAGKNRELIGTIDTGTASLKVLLVRVHLAEPTPIWLFAPETLQEVPGLHESFEPSQVEQFLPPSMRPGQGTLYRLMTWGVALAIYLAAFLAAFVLARLAWLIVRVFLRRLPNPDRVVKRWSALNKPFLWLVFGVIMGPAAGYLLTFRQRFFGTWVATLIVIGAATWLVVRAVAVSIARWTRLMERAGTTERIALVRLVGRLLQFAVAVIGVLALLQAFGINLTPVLAGLGVGGIAVALASQKTLENLFGGMMVIGDSPVRIGNFCRVGSMTGTVEDIGLRSTRIRTLTRTVISIPNAEIASSSIENFAARDKLLFQQTFSLRYETTPDQLRFVIAESRRLLYQHAAVEQLDARVRLLRFAPSGFDVEVFAYVLTDDYAQFLAIQEDLLLRLLDVVAASGTALAYPSQTMYLGRDSGLDKEGARRAAEAVEGWRREGGLPFPDFPPAEKNGMRRAIEYPPAGSALNRGRGPEQV